jgi:LPXTG-site transpeptidase (sortase) family protein
VGSIPAGGTKNLCYHFYMNSKPALNRIGNLFIFVGIGLLLVAYGPLAYDELWYFLNTQKNQEISLNNEDGIKDSPFARLISKEPINLNPVNTDFSIVIEKIGVNAPVNADITVTNKDAYNEALKTGIAHASVTDYPSAEPGNVYMFAHSAIDFWNLGKYAKVFNLLRKLEIGDNIHVFYEGDDYVYEVVNEEIYKGWDTYPLTRATVEPVLTLQTCDPPGTTLNRLVVTAVLKEVNESQ